MYVLSLIGHFLAGTLCTNSAMHKIDDIDQLKIGQCRDAYSRFFSIREAVIVSDDDMSTSGIVCLFIQTYTLVKITCNKFVHFNEVLLNSGRRLF